MLIGIHSVALFKQNRTGVEEYVYRLIKNIAISEEAKKHRFVLYTDKKPQKSFLAEINLPGNFKIKILRFPFFWTQIRLSWEMIFNKPDVLFSPAQVFPLIIPSKSVLTVHGLEYEFFPKTYSFFRRNYLRYLTLFSARRASLIITPSENTKEDLIRLYKIKRNKIFPVYHGFTARRAIRNQSISGKKTASGLLSRRVSEFLGGSPYILCIGRVELKKNLKKAVRAFNLAKSKFHIPHKLVFAGGRGFGESQIKKEAENSFFGRDIVFTGFVSESDKAELYRSADLLLFVSFYEGFGIPILEAQSFGIPVVTSSISSMMEIAGNGAVFVNPHNVDEITVAIFRAAENKNLRNTLAKNATENLKRFSWRKCAEETLGVLIRSNVRV